MRSLDLAHQPVALADRQIAAGVDLDVRATSGSTSGKNSTPAAEQTVGGVRAERDRERRRGSTTSRDGAAAAAEAAT